MIVIFSLIFVSHFHTFGTEYRLYTYNSALKKPSLRIPPVIQCFLCNWGLTVDSSLKKTSENARNLKDH